LRFRALVLAAAAALIVFGVVRLRDAPVDVLPEFGAPMIEIQTEALGLAATEVEELVTLNIEELLSGVPWVRTLRSKSVQGLSSVLLVFEPGTDIQHARQMVHERLIMAHALPNVSKPPNMLQPMSVSSRAMIIGLSSKDMSLIDMSVLARWTLMPKLLGVPGVANVAVWGMRSRQLQVQVDPERLRDKGVTLDQVVESTGDALWVSPLSYLEASTPGAGGWIDGPNQRLGIQHVQPIKTSPAELAKVPVDGGSLRLGDVAKVVEEHQPLIGDALINNEPGLLVVIEKLPHADPAEVVRGVEAALDELRPGLTGVTIDRQSPGRAARRCGSPRPGAVDSLLRVARGADQHRGDRLFSACRLARAAPAPRAFRRHGPCGPGARPGSHHRRRRRRRHPYRPARTARA
jgi:Cu/Ag efflux pump CusA